MGSSLVGDGAENTAEPDAAAKEGEETSKEAVDADTQALIDQMLAED